MQPASKFAKISTLLFVFISVLALFTPYVSMTIEYLFYPHMPERWVLIEQLLNNAANYYAIIEEHGKPPIELIHAYEKEYHDVLRTLGTDRYLIPDLSEMEHMGFQQLGAKQELIDAKIKLLKAKKLWK